MTGLNRRTDLAAELETLVDQYTLIEVLHSLQEVCGRKAAYIRENWQDEELAKAWENGGSAIEKAWAEARKFGGL